MSTPELVFSATVRVALFAKKSGALFVCTSSTLVTFIVTEIRSSPSLPSETVIVTE